MRFVKMVMIPADVDMEIVMDAQPDKMSTVSSMVGGSFVGLAVGGDEKWAAYGNALASLIAFNNFAPPVNARAHELLVKYGGRNPDEPIVGDVLIVGIDEEGQFEDVPQVMIDRLPNLIQTPRVKAASRAKDMLALYSKSDEALQDLLSDLQHYADTIDGDDEGSSYWEQVAMAAGFIHDDEIKNPDFGR